MFIKHNSYNHFFNLLFFWTLCRAIHDPSFITELLINFPTAVLIYLDVGGDYYMFLHDDFYYALLEKRVDSSTPMDIIEYINEKIAEDINSMVENNNAGHPFTNDIDDFNEALRRANTIWDETENRINSLTNSTNSNTNNKN